MPICHNRQARRRSEHPKVIIACGLLGLIITGTIPSRRPEKITDWRLHVILSGRGSYPSASSDHGRAYRPFSRFQLEI
ncbi:hypothetical protein FA13DRAFT_1732798 [Coprinellus micaceus]|uniref:Uncharacterized protein n=1 Tax=Coprinellus micaceus TaxID=71717 RepID=A0A4Y7TB07_COPMI|nr:hypothetical protein FA13DRAFT_1732798 [Coprinellus micaceus]